MSESDLIPDESPQAQSAPPAQAKGAKRKKKSIFADPVVRTLAIVASGLVILYIATVAGALVMGVLGSSEPKSKLERDLQNYETAAMAAPKDSGVWSLYIGALIADRQFSKAQDVIDKSSKVVDQAVTQDILAAQAELHYAKKDYPAAIKTADEVRKKLKTSYDKALEKNDSPESLGREINANYWRVLFLKAQSQVALGQKDAALKSLDEYLKENATEADVFVYRGTMRVEAGDKKGAEADFKQALKFIPDDKAALEGLKTIGAQQ